MARASNIYIISDRYGPIAGFTVKHEMIAALKSLRDENGERYNVFRCRDGYIDISNLVSNFEEIQIEE